MSEPELEFQEPPRGAAPVQSWGTINGYKFDFYARYEGWCLNISTNSDIDPIDIFVPDPHYLGLNPIKSLLLFGKLPVDIYTNEQGVSFEGEYKEHGPYGAGFMEPDEAERIIRECAKLFLEIVKEQEKSL